jgi:lysozyme
MNTPSQNASAFALRASARQAGAASQVALAFIKARESCRLAAYQDSGGIWTIGYGCTGPDVGPGAVWSQQAADDALARRVAALENAVALRTARASLSVQQSAALVSFAYNVGPTAFAGSHVLAFVLARNWIAAVKALLTWDHVNGVESQGLLKRRLEEAALFLEGA